MTVETTTCKTGPLACNGVVTTFNFDFPILAAEHLVVTKTDANDVETVLELNTDYTVTVAEYPGTGSITTLSAYATGNSITLNRDTPQTQEADIGNSGPFLAETHEDALDKLTMLVQEQIEKLSRAILMPISSTDSPPDPAAMLAALQAATEAAQDVIDNGAVPANRTITAGAGLTGGGDLSANRTISIPNSGVTAGTYSNASVTVNARGIITGISEGGSGAGSLYGRFNVRDYGAVGDGVTDDTEAVQDAVAELVAAGGGVLVFPGPCEYLMTEKIETEDVFLAILGDGTEHTKLVFNGSGGGIDFTDTSTSQASNGMRGLIVTGVTITTKELNGGNAISARFSTTGVFASRRVIVNDVQIRGYNHGGTHTHYWTKGLYVENSGVELHQFFMPGTHSGSQTNSNCVGIHLKVTSLSIIPLVANLSNVLVHLYYRALKVEGHLEGLHVSNFEFAESYYAVDIAGVSGHTPYGLHFSGGHVSGYISCFKLHYADGAHLVGVQMQHAAAPGGASVLDGNIVSLENCAAGSISGCSFNGMAGHTPGSSVENGIIFDGTSWGWNVSGCLFRDIADTAIFCTAGAYNIVAGGNSYHNVETKFYVLGERCVNKDDFRGAVYVKSSDQNVAEDTSVAVTWDTALIDTEAVSASPIYASGNPTRFTVPAGVTRVRISAQIAYITDGSGGYEGGSAIGMKKNNSQDYAGQPAGSSSSPIQRFITPVLVVEEGDYFEIYSLHDGGGTQPIKATSPGGGKLTWVCFEILGTDGSGA